jgi:hypothetical protein
MILSKNLTVLDTVEFFHEFFHEKKSKLSSRISCGILKHCMSGVTLRGIAVLCVHEAASTWLTSCLFVQNWSISFYSSTGWFCNCNAEAQVISQCHEIGCIAGSEQRSHQIGSRSKNLYECMKESVMRTQWEVEPALRSATGPIAFS